MLLWTISSSPCILICAPVSFAAGVLALITLKKTCHLTVLHLWAPSLSSGYNRAPCCNCMTLTKRTLLALSDCSSLFHLYSLIRLFDSAILHPFQLYKDLRSTGSATDAACQEFFEATCPVTGAHHSPFCIYRYVLRSWA